jgi:hypothetical protein
VHSVSPSLPLCLKKSTKSSSHFDVLSDQVFSVKGNIAHRFSRARETRRDETRRVETRRVETRRRTEEPSRVLRPRPPHARDRVRTSSASLKTSRKKLSASRAICVVARPPSVLLGTESASSRIFAFASRSFARSRSRRTVVESAMSFVVRSLFVRSFVRSFARSRSRSRRRRASSCAETAPREVPRRGKIYISHL